MTEKQIKKLYKKEVSASAPDMDALWSRIEENLSEKNVNAEDIKTPAKKPHITLKRGIVSVAALAACIGIAFAAPGIISQNDRAMSDMAAMTENAGIAENFADAEEIPTIENSSADMVGSTLSSKELDYFVEDDILAQTEYFIDAVVNNVFAGESCIYYELTAVNIYSDNDDISDTETIIVSSRSEYLMSEDKEYLIPVKNVGGETEIVFDGVPQIEFTEDGGIIYYNGWSALDSGNSQSIEYPQTGVDDFFYDRMKFSYPGDISKLIEKWKNIREE